MYDDECWVSNKLGKKLAGYTNIGVCEKRRKDIGGMSFSLLPIECLLVLLVDHF